MLAPVNTALMNEHLTTQLEYVLAGNARHNLTVQEFASKDANVLLFRKANDFLNNNRWREEFGEELKKRQFMFQPHFFIPDAFDDNLFDHLREYFRTDTTDKIKEFATKAAEVQSFCRGQPGADYKKAEKVKQSGVYDDFEALGGILKSIQTSKINENFDKRIKNIMANWKTNLPALKARQS